jgi:transcriptional regulator with XRE-family HTH domain
LVHSHDEGSQIVQFTETMAKRSNAKAAEPLSEVPHREFGDTVKAFRLRSGLSLRELALRTGLSVGMLSQIERNVTSPSLKTLTKLRIGLGVPLSALFEDQGDDPGPSARHSRVRSRDARPSLDIGDGILKVLLSPATASNLQLMMLVVKPGGGTKDTVVGVPGEKAALVMKGSPQVTIGDETHRLQEGDTIQFDAETPHSFANSGKAEAHILWVIGQLPAERHI